MLREAERSTFIIAEEARRRQLAGLVRFAESREGDSAVVPTLAQRDDDERKTRTQVKEEAPELVREVAQQQVEIKYCWCWILAV